jgi:hypothetical protein
MSKTKSLLWLNLIASGCAVLAGFQEHSEIRVEDGTTYRTTSRPNLPLAVMGGVSAWATFQLMKTAGDDYGDDEIEDEPSESPRRSRVIEPDDDDDDDFDFAPPTVASAPTISVPAPIDDPPPISLPPEPVKTPTIADRYGSAIATMADTTVPKHVAIVAATRMGKTYLIKAFLAAMLEQFPESDIRIIDPKDTEWPPLAKVTRPGNYDKFNPDAVVDFWESMQVLARQRQENPELSQKKLLIVADEWVSMLAMVKAYDDENKTILAKKIKTILQQLVYMAAHSGVHVVLITQSALCEDMGLTSQARRNFSWFGLARDENKTMIADEILGQRSVLFQSTKRKQEIEYRFLKLWNSPKRHKQIPVILDVQTEKVEYLPDFTNVVATIDSALPIIS